MSRVGNRVLAIPAGTSVSVEGSKVTVKGALGTLTREFSPLISVVVENNEVRTVRANDQKNYQTITWYNKLTYLKYDLRSFKRIPQRSRN